MHPANPENTQKLDETCQKGGKFNQKLSVATVGFATQAPKHLCWKKMRKEPVKNPCLRLTLRWVDPSTQSRSFGDTLLMCMPVAGRPVKRKSDLHDPRAEKPVRTACRSPRHVQPPASRCVDRNFRNF